MTDVDRVDDHYRVKIRREDYVMSRLDETRWIERFGDTDAGVITVPDRAITLRPDNPTGKAVLCYNVYLNIVFCFVPWEYGG